MASDANRSRRNEPVAAGFAERLKGCRRSTGLSQEELARRAGLHRTAVSLLERGKREPKLETVVKIADVLQVAVGDLLGETRWSRDGGFEFSERADVGDE